jgi:4-hydroxy-2-oxoheptanedioate aldolase
MITNIAASFRQKLKQRAVLGPFAKVCDPALVEIAGHAGFDFVILDLEHGPATVQTLQDMIRAADLGGALPVVRVKTEPLSLIGEVLDIGAGGVQVPHITTAAEAERVVQLARFAPRGMRGVCRFVRAAGYSSVDRFQYFDAANETLIILQLEGEEAVRNLDAICRVPGLDVVFIGPYDLSQSLGVAGQIDHPRVESMMRDIVRGCLEKDIAVGTFVDSLANARKWKKLGVRYVSYSVDVGIFYEHCVAIVSQLRDDA